MSFPDRYQKALDILSDPKRFGSECFYFAKGSTEGISFKGMKSREPLTVFLDGTPTATRKTTLVVNIVALRSKGIQPKTGDQIGIQGERFTIRSPIEEDGEGGAVITLSK